MLLLYWASAAASIGWVWIVATFADRAIMKDGKVPTLAKYRTRRGMAVVGVDTRLAYLHPKPIVVLVIVAVLSVLPFFAASVSPGWLAVLALVVLTLLVLGLWLLLNPWATPIFVETERTDAGEGKVNIHYKLEKYEQDHTMSAFHVVSAVFIWTLIAWILGKLGLSGWTLIGAINVIGIALASMYGISMWRARRD